MWNSRYSEKNVIFVELFIPFELPFLLHFSIKILPAGLLFFKTNLKIESFPHLSLKSNKVPNQTYWTVVYTFRLIIFIRSKFGMWDRFNTNCRQIVRFYIYLRISIFTFLTKKYNWVSPKSPYYVPTILLCYMGLTRRLLRMYSTDLSILKRKVRIKYICTYPYLILYYQKFLHVCIKFYTKIQIYWKLFN